MRRVRLHGPLGRSRGAWSLIELLIVVGICALLLGLLGVAIQQARWAALRVQAQNNLKQECLGSIQREAEEGLIWRPRDELHCPLADKPYAISYYLYGKPSSILPSSTTALYQEVVYLDAWGRVQPVYSFMSPYRYNGPVDTDPGIATGSIARSSAGRAAATWAGSMDTLLQRAWPGVASTTARLFPSRSGMWRLTSIILGGLSRTGGNTRGVRTDGPENVLSIARRNM